MSRQTLYTSLGIALGAAWPWAIAWICGQDFSGPQPLYGLLVAMSVMGACACGWFGHWLSRQ